MIIAEKKFKVTLDIAIQLEEITDDKLEEDIKSYSDRDEMVKAQWYKESVEKQKQLFDLIRQDTSVIDEMLRSIFHTILGSLDGEKEFRTTLDAVKPQESEEILMPVIQRLRSEDAKDFLKAIKDGYFYESTEHIQNRFVGEVTNVSIVEE